METSACPAGFLLAAWEHMKQHPKATHFVFKTFVIGSPNDPLTKAGGLSPLQERKMRKGK
jgi:hypothetical protein